MMNQVLILSHNPLSDYNNMGKTISSLFAVFNKTELAQLYFYAGYPNIDKCDSSYRITDMDVLKSFLGKRRYGRVIDFAEYQNYFDEKRKKSGDLLYKIGKTKTPFIYLMRDLIWSNKKWFNPDLKKWLDNLNVNSVFYAAGDSCFSYEMAIFIANYLRAPLITYFCDDFYFNSRFSFSPFYYIYRKKYKKYLARIIGISEKLIYISPSMEKSYYKEFKKRGEVILTPAKKITSLETKKLSKFPIVISYIGNVSLRYKSLLDIGNAIYKINKNKKIVEFNLYTQEMKKSIVSKLKKNRGINFKASIDSKQVEAVTLDSDIMFHVESFEKNKYKRIKHSISTKIPDILGFGKCIFAYGPKGIASIDYLSQNNAAFVCSDRQMLIEHLQEIIADTQNRYKYEKRALALAKKNHDSKINSQKLRKIFCLAQRN